MSVIKGILAGLMATVAVSAVMLLQRALGLSARLGIIPLVLKASGAIFGTPLHDRALGWIVHFFMGTMVGGVLFVFAEPKLQADTCAKRGVLFGLLVWLAFMLVLMPLAGAGPFGFRISVLAPLALLVFHLIYGVVLGWTYGKLHSSESLSTRDPRHAA